MTDFADVSDERLQELLGKAVAELARRAERRRIAGQRAPAPFRPPNVPSDTEVVIAVRVMLDARAIAPFEVAMAPIGDP